MCQKDSFSAPLRVLRYNNKKLTQTLSNSYVFQALSHLAFAPYKSFGAQSGLLIYNKNLKGSSGSSSLVTTSTMPAISKPFLITSGLFRHTSRVLLFCKIFRCLKFRTVLFLGTFFCPKLKSSESFCK